jgi:DUF917 family protein
LLPSVEGAKIRLDELSLTRSGDIVTLKTQVTAKEDVTDFKVITQLEDDAELGKVLLYKSEKIDAMVAGEIKVIQTVYSLKGSIAKIKKRVMVYDKKPGDTLSTKKLEHSHSTS